MRYSRGIVKTLNLTLDSKARIAVDGIFDPADRKLARRLRHERRPDRAASVERQIELRHRAIQKEGTP